MIVIYHAGCFDGFCAAWLFHLWKPDAQFVPASYGDAPPDVVGEEVYVLDFSYPAETLLEMQHDAKLVHVMDHHETAEEDLAGLDDHDRSGTLLVDFDLTKSGARMAWEFLLENEDCLPRHVRPLLGGEPHWLVRYTEDRDLWSHELYKTREINAFIRSYPWDFKLWDEWGRVPEGELESLAAQGGSILRYRQQIVDQHKRFARWADVTLKNGDTLVLPAVNCSAAEITSDMLGQLAEETQGVAASWVDQGDGNQLWSLRSRGNFHVGKLAKHLGGGGHPNAAGFKCPVGTIRIGARISESTHVP